MKENAQKFLSALPKVDKLLESEDVKRLLKRLDKSILLTIIQDILSEKREEIITSFSDGAAPKEPPTFDFFIREINNRAEELLSDKLVRVVNATGAILHTNLGRAPLSKNIAKKVAEISACYSNLEFDLEDGERGERYSHFQDTVRLATGAESAIAVNNNAAAVLLTLNTFCDGKEAIVSRGELIEIGGAFRIPDVMKKSQAILKEVGATNKTNLNDYKNAITPNTGLLLKVHTSNYKIVGFTQEVALTELVALGKERDIPVCNDLGSGCLIDLSRFGIAKEMTAQEVIKAGADIVTFSGDKLLGGPQAGIIAGKRKYIDKIKSNPLTRALRLDKMTICALEQTFKEYLRIEKAMKNTPTLIALAMSKEQIKKRCKTLFDDLVKLKKKGLAISMREDFSYVGGGALPLEKLPTYIVALTGKKTHGKSISCDKIAAFFRGFKTPIIARISDNQVILDARTLLRGEEKIILSAVEELQA